MGLQRYIQKRNFRDTPEPKGVKHRGKPRALSFVIQKHAARRLHYDFRLEMDGVLKSWAVPKGIPLRKGEKRLAMHVEDHPLEYGGFEGIIPEGNYGAGTVMLWDRGTYELLGGEPSQAYKQGKLHFRLAGKKLVGEWTLVRMRGREEKGKEPWLLIKTGEDAKPISAKMDDQSVLSKKSMAQIAQARGKVWHSNQPVKEEAKKTKVGDRGRPVKLSTPRAPTKPETLPTKLLNTLEQFPVEPATYVEPMMALLVDKVPRDPGWVFEVKWDGYRTLSVKKNKRVRLFSRRARDITPQFPEIAEAVEGLPFSNMVLDGEVVAVNPKGHASFQLLQNYQQRAAGRRSSALRYQVFDILNLENRDLKQLPLERRKAILQALLSNTPDPIRYSATLEGDPEDLLAQAQKNQMEGLIGKRIDSPYQPGRRSGAWIKLKASHEQEFVIGGYTAPRGARTCFGAILVGYFEGEKLIFASKVGTGFDTNTFQDLYARFQKLRIDRCPFSNLPSSNRQGGLSRAEMNRCTWLEPKLICQVRFTEWTDAGGLRHPVFLGLRDDKSAREVVREEAVA
jgi:bifunctional non-homologous end joining protein LigD